MLEPGIAVTTQIPLQSLLLRGPEPSEPRARNLSGRNKPAFGMCHRALKMIVLNCLCVSISAFAQSSTPPTPTPAPPSEGSKDSSMTPAPPKLTTTVVVHDEVKDNYLPESVTVGTLDGGPLRKTPLSVTVLTRDLLNDQVSRLLSDLVKNDASVGDDYVPVGYYGNYQIRGFPIDLATGLEVNGMTIAGEQDVSSENKQSVEFLKGIAKGLQEQGSVS